MKNVITDFKCLELFNYYNHKDNPFICVTTKVDITNLYKLGKKHGSCYGTIGYYIALAMNEIDEFKFRYEDGKFFKYDVIMPSYTQMLEDKTIGFFACPMLDKYEDFIDEYNKINNDFIKSGNAFQNNGNDVIWYSCTPWFHFNSLMPTYEKNVTIPQVNWDKFSFENGRCYINMMIAVHHGFVDGYHIGLFLKKLNEYIVNIDV